MASYLRNKSDRELEELIEATTEEKVIEGFSGMSRGMFALLAFLIMVGLVGGFVYFNA